MSDNLRLSAAKVSDVKSLITRIAARGLVSPYPTILGPESISRLNRRCR